jgi:hypothetical protein
MDVATMAEHQLNLWREKEIITNITIDETTVQLKNATETRRY